MRYRVFVMSIVLAPLMVAAARPQATMEVTPDTHATRVRLGDDRIAEVFHYAMTQSPSFRDLVATLELLERTVSVEDGKCRHREQNGCFRLAAEIVRVGVVVRIDASQPMRSLVPQLAHELYHAVEIAREPLVTDAASLEALFARIGERHCPGDDRSDCWETRAAAAFEQLVERELVRADEGKASGPSF